MRHGAHFDQQPAQIGAEIVPARLSGEERQKACRSHLSAVWPLILDGDHLMMDLVSGGFRSACPIGMRQVQCKIHVNAELAERKAGCGNSRSSCSIILIKQQTIECFWWYWQPWGLSQHHDPIAASLSAACCERLVHSDQLRATCLRQRTWYSHDKASPV